MGRKFDIRKCKIPHLLIKRKKHIVFLIDTENDLVNFKPVHIFLNTLLEEEGI